MAQTPEDAKPGASLAAELLAIVSLLVSSAGLTISLAALVFSGTIADGLPRGTTVFLLGAGITTILIALCGTVPGAISPVQDGPTIVLVAVAAKLIADSATATTATHVIIVIGLASLITGLFMFVLGQFALGGAIRFIPAVVINAFVAGTGCLLFLGGLSVMISADGHGVNPTELFAGGQLKYWLPGVALGLAAYLVSNRPEAPDGVVPGLIVIATAAFYVVTLAASSIQAVEEASWLVGPFNDPASLSLITPTELADAPWSKIIGQLPGLVAVADVATLALMLNVTGLETVTKHRADLNQELKVTGVANVIQSVLGAAPSYHAIGFTALAHRMGVATKRTPAIVGSIIVVFALVGARAIGYTPRFVVGSLLVAVGVSLIMDWVHEMRRVPGVVDTVISLVIIGCMVAVGVLEGILLGVIIACGVFIVRYSRVDPIRRWRTGTTARSQVDRTAAELETLLDNGERTKVNELQGFLFFGSVTGMSDRVTEECQSPVENVIFDFRHVTGIDGSALTLLHRLIEDLTGQGLSVTLTAAPHPVTAGGLNSHSTLDEALADVEQGLLEGSENLAAKKEPIRPDLLEAFERRTVPAGRNLLTTGDEANELIYVLSGSLSVYSPSDKSIGSVKEPKKQPTTKQRFRLRKVGGPNWIGEIGFLRGTPRIADVVADTDIEMAVIDRAAFEQLRTDQPDVIIELLDNIASEQANLVDTLSSALSQASG